MTGEKRVETGVEAARASMERSLRFARVPEANGIGANRITSNAAISKRILRWNMTAIPLRLRPFGQVRLGDRNRIRQPDRADNGYRRTGPHLFKDRVHLPVFEHHTSESLVH